MIGTMGALLRMVLAILLTLPASFTPVAALHSAELVVGTSTLHRCDLVPPAVTWCGSLSVPLDPEQPIAATIRIGFAWIAAAHRTQSTVVAQEGGPGYPSTGSLSSFVSLFGPLLQNRNLLVVDARGTGRSAPIDCAPLQSEPSPSTRIGSAIRRCGRQLNHTFPLAGGGFVHASDLFTTSNAVGDLAAVIRSLQLAPVDFYGDSYGTFFGQSLLARYPKLLRSVVLDSAYEAYGLDPWYRSSVETARQSFDAVCARAPDCPPGSSWKRIERLAESLRVAPITGRAPALDGSLTKITVDVTALVNIVNDAGYDPDPDRQLDAAARAYLDNHDPIPLLRLYAQDVGWDYSDYSGRAVDYSDGLYFAVACTDYQQLFSMNAAPALRRQQLTAAISSLPTNTFAPFTTAEWITVLPYTESYSACVDWPTPTHRSAAAVPDAASLSTSAVPVLVLNGEFDSLTPSADGARVAKQIGSTARAVIAANTVHLVALDGAHPCGSRLVRTFVADPHWPLDASCADHNPPIRAVSAFPGRLDQTPPATGAQDVTSRRIAGLAVALSGDVVARSRYLDGGSDRGLRGGKIRYDVAGAELCRVRWTADTEVSGRVKFDGATASAVLQVTAPDGKLWRVRLKWAGAASATVYVNGDELRVAAP